MNYETSTLYYAEAQRRDAQGREIFPASPVQVTVEGELRHVHEFQNLFVSADDVANRPEEIIGTLIADCGSELEDEKIAEMLTTSFRLMYNKVARQKLRIKHDRVSINLGEISEATKAAVQGLIPGFGLEWYTTQTDMAAASKVLVGEWIKAGKPVK